MKNKKLTYILLPAVLLIWGTIIYRILNSRKDTEQMISADRSVSMDFRGNQMEHFTLQLGYQDPFLSDKPKIELHRPLLKSPKTSEKKNTAIPAKPWPEILYDGTIRNQKSMKTLAMLRINGQSSLVAAGENVNEIKLLKIFKDSIEVVYGKEKKTIHK